MLDFANLVSSLPGGVAQGLIWGIMAIGVYLTYKILDIADLTVDGTMCTGGAVCVMMIINGHSVPVALLCAFLAGMAAGLSGPHSMHDNKVPSWYRMYADGRE